MSQSAAAAIFTVAVYCLVGENQRRPTLCPENDTDVEPDSFEIHPSILLIICQTCCRKSRPTLSDVPALPRETWPPKIATCYLTTYAPIVFETQCTYCYWECRKQRRCIDAVGWAAGRASGLQKTEWRGAGVVICYHRLAYGPDDATATHCLLLQ